METQVEGTLRLDAQALHLLARLAEFGYNVVWEKDFRSYDVIELDIAASDALLAIVDSIWTSSTWMAIEATYANGLPGSGITTNLPMTPIPILLYPVDYDLSKHNLHNLWGMRETTLLDLDIEKAVVQVIDVLPLSVVR